MIRFLQNPRLNVLVYSNDAAFRKITKTKAGPQRFLISMADSSSGKEIRIFSGRDYLLRIVDATRHTSRLLTGVSPRGSLMLQRAAMAFAAVSGRSYVTPDDVRYLAPCIFGHRVMPAAGTADPAGLIREIASGEPVPVENWS